MCEIFPNGKFCWCNNNEWNDILGAFTLCACSMKVYSIAWRPLNRWWRKNFVCVFVCVCVFMFAYWCISVWKFVVHMSLSPYRVYFIFVWKWMGHWVYACKCFCIAYIIIMIISHKMLKKKEALIKWRRRRRKQKFQQHHHSLIHSLSHPYARPLLLCSLLTREFPFFKYFCCCCCCFFFFFSFRFVRSFVRRFNQKSNDIW